METTTNGSIHTSEEVDECSDHEVALSHGCLKFSEVWDPIEAMRWITRMESVFEVIKYADDDKLMYAASMLRSEARVWWDMVKVTSEPETATKMTWSRFKEVFKDEFCPVHVELELVEQYRTLKQERDERVQDYTTRFERLWWFVWDYLTYEKRMIYHYVSGLTAEIKDFMSTSDMTTFENTVEVARVINQENIRLLEERNDRKRKRKRTCDNCGKRHEGGCRYGSNECYRCGKLGHLARECRSD